jgi:hypothetical protein
MKIQPKWYEFSGTTADVWCGSETSEALILMGVWCGADTADTTRKKTGMRLRLQVGSGVYQRERNRKSHQKLRTGEYCLLTGAF